MLEECRGKSWQADEAGPLSLVICVTERLEIIDGCQDEIELLGCAELMQAISHRDTRLLHAWHWEALLHTVANGVDILLEALFLVRIRRDDLIDP